MSEQLADLSRSDRCEHLQRLAGTERDVTRATLTIDWDLGRGGLHVR